MYKIILHIKGAKNLSSKNYFEPEARQIYNDLRKQFSDRNVRAIEIETAYGNFVTKNCDNIDSIELKEI